jgi:16S rRNA (cytosine967-C5)-methyltransferase
LIIDDRGDKKGPVDKLPGYKEGLFIIQDEAAAFVSKVVDAKPGEVIVDLCAAPGGKTITMAESMENRGRILAIDLHEKRLEMLKRTRNRVGLTNIEVFTKDGTTYDPGIKVDRVLLDAPCTGTGVINRRADLRYQRQEPDINSLVELQRKLLDNAANMLKDNGVLVYSTCSLEPEENEQNLKWFLETHPQFKTASLLPFVPESFAENDAKLFESGAIQLTPARHDVSGFYIARLEKHA